MKPILLAMITGIIIVCACKLPIEQVAAQTKVKEPKPNPIDDKYKAIGGSSSALGTPSGNEQSGTGGGRFRLYQNGGIYWSQATGVHYLSGAAFQKYKDMGAASGVLSYPVTDVTEIAVGMQEAVFQHGIITLNKAGKAEAKATPWATFTDSGASVQQGAKIVQRSANTAALLPISGNLNDGVTFRCKCSSYSLGACTVTITGGNTVTCTKGGCRGSCVITVEAGGQ